MFSILEANSSSPTSSCFDDCCRDLDLNPPSGSEWLVALEVALSPHDEDNGRVARRSRHKTRSWKLGSELATPLDETSGYPLTSLGPIFLTLKPRGWTKRCQILLATEASEAVVLEHLFLDKAKQKKKKVNLSLEANKSISFPPLDSECSSSQNSEHMLLDLQWQPVICVRKT